MTLMEMFSKVAIEIPNITSLTEVKDAVNRVISDINAKWPGDLHTDEITRLFANTKESCTYSTGGDNDTIQTTTNFQAKGLDKDGMIYVSGSTYSKNNGPFKVGKCEIQNITLADLDDYVVEETAEVTISGFTLVNALYPDTSSIVGKDYTINARLNEITVDPKVKEFISIFNNNIELERRDREYVKNSNNKSAYCYAMVGRSTILLPESIFSVAEDVLTIKMLKKLSELSSTSLSTTISSTEVIDIPLALEGMLFSGVMVCLLAKPQYTDDALFKLNTEFYMSELRALSDQEYSRYETGTRDLNYKY